uniref:NR LBD domain-containing protein n=1 Tax=Acrobeloides nanus TaxID=290746 RepID=A0A914C2R4_9BILA
MDRFHRNCVPLMYSMIDEFFDPSQLLNSEQKHLVIKSFAMKFWFLMKDYQTVKIFPKLDDTRQTIDQRFVIDYNNPKHIQYFVSEFERPEEHFDITINFIKMGRELVNQFIVQECEKFPTIEHLINDQKDIVLKETYAYCISKFGIEQGGVKFCNLFNLLSEITNHGIRLIEDMTILKIFLNDFYDSWLELEKCEEKITDLC